MTCMNNNLWQGLVNNSIQIVNIVGIYGKDCDPIVRVEEGLDQNKCFVIKWDTGKIVRELNLI
jgi:hypothetical protein